MLSCKLKTTLLTLCLFDSCPFPTECPSNKKLDCFCQTGAVGNKATAVLESGRQANQRAENVRLSVSGILEDLPKQLEKTVPLTTDSLNTKRDIVQARAQGRRVW